MLLRGDAGWGEFSPFLEYDAATAAPWLRAAREAADEGWPAPVRDRVPVNVTVPGGRPGAGAPRSSGPATAAAPPRSRSPSPARPSPTTQARLEAVRDALGPDGADPGRRQRRSGTLDDGGRRDPRCWTGRPAAWSTSSSRAPTSRTSRVVRRRVDVPVAADESIRRAEDPYRVRDLEAADVAVLKVQPLGGVRACLRIAEDIGLPVVVSSALETSVGHRRRGRPGRRAARAASTPAGWPPCSCSPATWSRDAAAAGGRHRCPSYAPRWTPALLARCAAAPDRRGRTGRRRLAAVDAAGSATVSARERLHRPRPRRRRRAGPRRASGTRCSRPARARPRSPSPLHAARTPRAG